MPPLRVPPVAASRADRCWTLVRLVSGPGDAARGGAVPRGAAVAGGRCLRPDGHIRPHASGVATVGSLAPSALFEAGRRFTPRSRWTGYAMARGPALDDARRCAVAFRGVFAGNPARGGEPANKAPPGGRLRGPLRLGVPGGGANRVRRVRSGDGSVSHVKAWAAAAGTVCVGVLMALAGSGGGSGVDGIAVFTLCDAGAFAVQWIAFVPAYLLATERSFDGVGAATFPVRGLGGAGRDRDGRRACDRHRDAGERLGLATGRLPGRARPDHDVAHPDLTATVAGFGGSLWPFRILPDSQSLMRLRGGPRCRRRRGRAPVVVGVGGVRSWDAREGVDGLVRQGSGEVSGSSEPARAPRRGAGSVLVSMSGVVRAARPPVPGTA